MSTKGLEDQIAGLVAGEGAGLENFQDELELFDGDLGPIAASAEARRARGPGRPAGSRNKANLDVVRFIKATRRPALLALAEVVDTPWPDLAKMLGCSHHEAAEFWRKCAAELLPYMEKRQPLAVDVTGQVNLVPVVVFQDTPVDPALAAGNPPLEGFAREVTDWPDPAAGDDVSPEMSHDDALTLALQGPDEA